MGVAAQRDSFQQECPEQAAARAINTLQGTHVFRTRSILTAGALVSGQQILTQALHLVRHIIVAWVLTPKDFGIAATFWLTTGLLTKATELGFKQLLIQDPEGDDDDFGATIQTMVLVRGLLIASVIFFGAGPLAGLFRAPETAWAFRLLAVLPILSGLRHRDMERLQRRLRFRPVVISQLGPEILVTAAAWPVVTYVGNYSAFVWLSIAGAMLAVPLSHLMAERPLRFRFDWTVVRRAFNFGWPLLLNSLLMFGALQGDRVILSQAYSKAELGVYSVAIGLVMAPSGMLSSAVSALMLPLLSAAQNDRVSYRRQYLLFAQMTAAAGLLLGVLFFILGPALVTLLYSDKYQLAGAVIGWLAARQAIRLFRIAPITAAIASGDTRAAPVANTLGQIGLGLAAIVAIAHGSLTWIAVAGVAGEIVSMAVSVAWLRWKHALPLGLSMIPGSVLVGGLLVSAWIGSYCMQPDDPLAAGFVFLLAIAASLALISFAFAELRTLMCSLIRPVLARTGITPE